MSQVIIHHKGQSRPATLENYQTVMDELCAQLGPWDAKSGSRVEIVPATLPVAPSQSLANSTFGKLVHDSDAQARIEKQHAALQAAGIAVDSSEQYFATGTRMADSGYATQTARQREHSEKAPLRDVAAQLTQTIRDEQRRELTMSGREIAKSLAMNGKLTVNGFALREHAIRGLLARAESKAATYVFALRDRLLDRERSDRDADRTQILSTMVRELEANPDTEFQLRVREALGDCFAVVSPGYGIADAPLVVPEILTQLGHDAKGSMSYDATSTNWELRAHVWTPTPVQQQAVGEPFEGQASFRGNDAGSGRLGGGGLVLLLRCLNASVYAAESSNVSRVHRGRVLVDLAAMVAGAIKAIDACVEVWGTARETVIAVDLPKSDDGKLIPLADAIPGLFRNMFTDRRSELVGVLPGRRETHVEALSALYATERRDPDRLVRSDLGQALTRYAQDQPSFRVRRDLEEATVSWLASSHVPRFEPVSSRA